MPTVFECPAPDKSELAFHNPAGGMHIYQPALDPNVEYWANRYQEAENNGDLAIHGFSSAIVNQLQLSKQALDGDPKAPISKEYARRLALGTLSVGLLIRRQWNSSTVVGDALAHGLATTLFDFGADLDEDRLPVPSRIHTVQDHDGEPETWYDWGNLYIRRIRPVEITDAMEALLQQSRVAIDRESLVTLYPYLKSKN